MDRQIKTNFRLEQWEERRFIGKSIYVRAVMDASPENIYSSKLCGALWAQKDWIFEELDKMSEYATEDQEAVGLITWEKFDEKNMLFGYNVGRFMKAGTPVPAYMDYIDLPAVCVAKGTKKAAYNIVDGWATGDFFFVVGCDELWLYEEAALYGYERASNIFVAEAYPDEPDENGIIPKWESWAACKKSAPTVD